MYQRHLDFVTYCLDSKANDTDTVMMLKDMALIPGEEDEVRDEYETHLNEVLAERLRLDDHIPSVVEVIGDMSLYDERKFSHQPLHIIEPLQLLLSHPRIVVVKDENGISQLVLNATKLDVHQQTIVRIPLVSIQSFESMRGRFKDFL
jgi:hypothetical protein